MFQAVERQLRALNGVPSSDLYLIQDIVPYFSAADLFMGGLGTASCGPAVADEFRVPDHGKGSITFFWIKENE